MEGRGARRSEWPTEMARNSHGEWEFGDEAGDFASATIKDIAFLLAELGRGVPDEESGVTGGIDFENGVFEMHPYHWGKCTCGVGTGLHHGSCAIKRPNFKCGDLELRWYHAIGPGMTANRLASRGEIRRTYLRCLDSLL